MKSIEKADSGLWIACFPYFSLGTIRRAIAECLEDRWMVLPVKGDEKAAELYRQKLTGAGIDACSVCNASAAVAIPGRQVERLVEYGVGKLKQNMAGLQWGPNDFDREWLDASRLTNGRKRDGCSWKVTADTAQGVDRLRELGERYGTTTAFVHDEDGSWTVLYTSDELMLLAVAGELSNLAHWMEAALKVAANRRGGMVRDVLGGYPGISSDEQVWHGFPCYKRTRVPVHLVLEYVKAGLTQDDLLKRLPYLRQHDLCVARELALDLKQDLRTLPHGLEAGLESLA